MVHILHKIYNILLNTKNRGTRRNTEENWCNVTTVTTQLPWFQYATERDELPMAEGIQLLGQLRQIALSNPIRRSHWLFFSILE